MIRDRLREFEEWFEAYLRLFEAGDEEIRRNTLLKKDHTFRVRAEILYLGKKLGLPEDHAALGVKILKEHRVLAGLDGRTWELILKAVAYHNRAVLPEEESFECLFFTRLLRDADKIDIWKVVTDCYRRENPARDRAIEIGLPDTPGFSPDIYQARRRFPAPRLYEPLRRKVCLGRVWPGMGIRRRFRSRPGEGIRPGRWAGGGVTPGLIPLPVPIALTGTSVLLTGGKLSHRRRGIKSCGPPDSR